MRRAKVWSKALLACALGACACLGGVLLWPGVAGSQGESPWPALGDPGVPQGGGEKDAALIVGIENYFVVEDVPGAHANALEWHTFLRENKKVPYVKWLKNEEGTRENMEAQLEETLKRVKPGGKLWFIYIGHGAPLDGGKDGGLVGVDGQQNAASIQARSLPREVLLQKIQRQGVPAVVVLDACFSGRAQTGASLAPGLQPLVPVKGLDSGKVLLLTAAGSDQYAGPLPGAKRPAFSYLALGALRGWADQDGDGKVTGSEVRQYTDDTLSQLLNDRNQTPQMSGYDAVLSSGRGLEDGPSLSKVMGSLGSGGGNSQGGNVGGDSGGFGGGGVAVKPSPKVEEPWSAGGGVASIEIVEFASQPSGLPVTVNGKVLCQSTPCSKELPVGTYQVSIGGGCVESREESVRVVASKGASVDWKLSPKTAGIEVRAYDQDDNALRAVVYVDGQKVGQAPGTFTVSACSKSLEVKLDGYTTHSASLSLRERQTSSVKAMLKSSSGGGGSNAGMVRVPAGKFTRGSNSGGSDEKPVREIYLSEYWIDTYEVTVDQYRACVDAGKCSKPDTSAQYCSGEWADRNNWTQNRGKHPVNCVSWTQADQYCRWAGKRLPTEAQWEKAARGTDGRTYPWGEEVPGSDGRKYGNFADASAKQKWSGWSVISGYDDGWATTSPVGSFEVGKSPYGAHDMSGNVWEWVSDWYSEDTYQSAPERDPEGPKSGSLRVGRGGGFSFDNVSWLRAANRSRDVPAVVYIDLGFRCARSSTE